MTKIGTYWAAGVAYVSLLFGAGLSVAGNLADTYRVRGDAVDAVDLALAIGPPVASLLVAELFVSAWPRTISVQSVRWLGTVVVGSLAMIVSWLHIHELLLARGQLMLVAILWPLAIDGLAIMAMAKILVSRRGHVATGADMVTAEWPTVDEMATVASGHEPGAPFVEEWPEAIGGHGHDGQPLDAPLPQRWPHDDAATHPLSPAYAASLATELNQWVAGNEQARTDIGEALAAEASMAMATQPASPPPVAQGVRVPQEARILLTAWAASQDGPAGKDVDQLLGAHLGRSARTARKWRSIVVSGPVSPA